MEEVFGSVAAVALHVRLEAGEARVEERGWRLRRQYEHLSFISARVATVGTSRTWARRVRAIVLSPLTNEVETKLNRQNILRAGCCPAAAA